ncbi:jerky protein homolog-like [Aedes albopictus]|uniref:DDE-1 domain-containing protein n=1 Tax=Aedes albopictus TaxID=7160 RepID=A0ABM1ZGU7_AEDAL
MRRFKDRFGLHVKRVAGEKASADTASYLKFKDVLEEQILEMGLKKSQVYNADESAIFIKMLASRSVVLSHESKASGRKLNKMRYTFMPCSNVDGSNKLKLMFIGTAAKPRSFPAKELLPVSYYNSKKAWMTRELFRTWFYNEFIPAVREFSERFNLEPKALLVLDNCTAHYDGGDKLISDDGLIKVIYLPPNVTSECQPMDQAVINAIKMRYKRKLMLKLVLEDEQLKFEDRLKKITLQQSIDWLSAAWDEISSSTIENSWKKLINQFPECDWSSADLDVPDNVDDISCSGIGF